MGAHHHRARRPRRAHRRRLPDRRRPPRARPQLALPRGRARHRRPRGRRPRLLRGQDPPRGRLRPSRSRRSPRPSSAGCASWPSAGWPRTTSTPRSCASTSSGVLVRPSRPGAGHAPAGGVPVTLARTWSVGLAGVHGAMVEVEVDMAARGAAAWSSSGCPTPSCASRSTGCAPRSSTPVPASRSGGSPSGCRRRPCRSRGAASTSPWPPAVLAASGAVPRQSVDRLVLLGELGLDGSVRAIRGVLPAVLAAARAGHAQVVVPAANADEAALVDERRGAGRVRTLGRGRRPPRRPRRALTAHVRGPRRRSRRRRPTSATSSVRRRAGGRSRSRPPAGTTCS